LATAAPMPREPPVTSATLLANLDIKSPLTLCEQLPTPLKSCLKFSGFLSDVAVVRTDLALWGNTSYSQLECIAQNGEIFLQPVLFSAENKAEESLFLA
jgi:hypothetical protein